MDISVVLPILVTLFGGFMMIKLRFFFIVHPIKTVKLFFTSIKNKKNFKALSLALAGTLGVGNIFGVASAIMIGGAGSVLWLFLSALFSMVIKYSETTLASTAAKEAKGTYNALRKSFKKMGARLSLVYTVLFLVLAFFMGAALQSKAIYDSMMFNNCFPVFFAFVFSLLILISVKGGGDKIEKITGIIIPTTTVVYILICFAVVFKNINNLNEVIVEILESAFSPLAIGGGAIGVLTSKALKQGFARGILSNEAGIGTSAMAHTRAEDRAAAVAGLYGICEVFFDTVILCPLTAFAILTSGVDVSSASSPMGLVRTAFVTSLGEPFGYLLGFLILSFGYSTVTCWYYYGSECSGILFKRWGKYAFVPFYVMFIFIGTLADNSFVLYITDLVILFMSFITIALLFKEREIIKKETELVGLL